MTLQTSHNGSDTTIDADEGFQPIQEQQRRHNALTASKHINAILAKYMAAPHPFKAATPPFSFVFSPPANGEDSKKNDNMVFMKGPCQDDRAEIRESSTAADSEMVWAVSPFPHRRPTLWLTAYDRPWDGDPSFGDPNTYVRPSPLPLLSTEDVDDAISWDSSNNRTIPIGVNGTSQTNRCSAVPTVLSSSEWKETRSFTILRRIPKDSSGRSFSELSYVLGNSAVPFSGLISTLKGAGFRCVSARKALLDTSWSLKWIKHPLPSDFKGVNPASFQKLNHFPGTSRLGRKDTLHLALCAASERWRQYIQESNKLKTLSTSHCCHSTGLAYSHANDRDRNPEADVESFGEELFPKAWLLPEGRKACEAFLRDPQHHGMLFIVKPAAGACGRGVYLLKGGPNVDISPPQAAFALREGDPPQEDNTVKDSFSDVKHATMLGKRSFPDRFLVQQYLSDPYLVYGYKFDLRLYVVITSYEPVRMYLYKEGLVRFATSPYYDAAASCGSLASSKRADGLSTGGSPTSPLTGEDSTSAIADIGRLTAHLTNFTINKKSEDFVIPCSRGEGRTEETSSEDGVMVSKWSLAALRAYMEQDGVDWESTMERVKDLLAKVFLSFASDVRKELRELEQEKRRGGCEDRKATFAKPKPASQRSGSFTESSSSILPTIPPPPCTVKGICPFFEIYGVDVLLRRSSQHATNSSDITIPNAGGPPCKAASATGVVLNPAIIEVNIMPSLSTHYSPLDQCIKGNFITDTLNLVGITPNAHKSSFTSTLKLSSSSSTAKGVPRGDSNASAVRPSSTTSKVEENAGHGAFEFSAGERYGDDDLLDRFLHGKPRAEVEACLVTEEERLRSPHFTRLLPTSNSFSRYKPLLLAWKEDLSKDKAERHHGIDKIVASVDPITNTTTTSGKNDDYYSSTPWQSLDEVLSQWEIYKERSTKNDIKN